MGFDTICSPYGLCVLFHIGCFNALSRFHFLFWKTLLRIYYTAQQEGIGLSYLNETIN